MNCCTSEQQTAVVAEEVAAGAASSTTEEEVTVGEVVEPRRVRAQAPMWELLVELPVQMPVLVPCSPGAPSFPNYASPPRSGQFLPQY